ncbi:Non-phototropic hypocotyl [Heracleum sosnowskyi]|uniref:Non-phototropic hypocotyl n=1 Tax=Heracleum sosnowskyi TaxID=360622 RepID=A0AAD8MRZ0_9APIA|nr:Non-phototropic hypocotyl [Heracleum sosnowskyi]
MYEECGEGNLVTHAETFLNAVLANWIDTIKALETCEEVLPHAKELRIVSRCIDSLATKACSDQPLFSWPVSGRNAGQSSANTLMWNGIRTVSKPQHVSEDWWYEDVSFLRLPLYKRLILAVGSRGMKPERIAGSLIFYAKNNLPLIGGQLNSEKGNRAGPQLNLSASSEADQRILLEEIVELLPDQKGVIPTKILLKLLRTSMILHASQSVRENLEKRIGAQLDQAVLADLLIPNMGDSVETLYDIDCVQRMLNHFITVEKDVADTPSNCLVDEEQLLGIPQSLTPSTMVANLVDSYLAEVASDVNLKLPKFQSLAAVLPTHSRSLDDGIYRAIDIYLKKIVACLDSCQFILFSVGVAADSWMAFTDKFLTLDNNSNEKNNLKKKMLKLIDIYYDALDAPKSGKEDDIDEITWQTYKGQLTEKWLDTRPTDSDCW